VQRRVQVIRRFQQLLHGRKPEVAQVITRGAGKPLVEALLTEIMGVLDASRFLIENAYRLLREQGQLALVFPEGTKGPGKLYSERYRLRRFGRGGECGYGFASFRLLTGKFGSFALGGATELTRQAHFVREFRMRTFCAVSRMHPTY